MKKWFVKCLDVLRRSWGTVWKTSLWIRYVRGVPSYPFNEEIFAEKRMRGVTPSLSFFTMPNNYTFVFVFLINLLFPLSIRQIFEVEFFLVEAKKAESSVTGILVLKIGILPTCFPCFVFIALNVVLFQIQLASPTKKIPQILHKFTLAMFQLCH